MVFPVKNRLSMDDRTKAGTGKRNMHEQSLGTTGLTVSALGLGCGDVGGLMVRGLAKDRERAVAMALDRGVTYFDTAAKYGEGVSEENIGRIWKVLRPRARLGTKVTMLPSGFDGPIAAWIAGSLEASLKRLGVERVDLYQFHNPIAREPSGNRVSAAFVIEEVAPVLHRLKAEGKVAHVGFTALGETDAVLEVIEKAGFETAQMVHNLLNPTATVPPPKGFVGQDYGRMMVRAKARGLGTIAIRILAGGALSGVEDRHPIATPSVQPIGSGATYADDVARARRMLPMVEAGIRRKPARGRRALWSFRAQSGRRACRSCDPGATRRRPVGGREWAPCRPRRWP